MQTLNVGGKDDERREARCDWARTARRKNLGPKFGFAVLAIGETWFQAQSDDAIDIDALRACVSVLGDHRHTKLQAIAGIRSRHSWVLSRTALTQYASAIRVTRKEI